MASITRFPVVSRLRAESNQYILHYTNGKVSKEGAGIAYWYIPLSAAVAQIPVEDIETTFLLTERSSDFQDIAVQCTLIYRFVDYAIAAGRINFSISLATGAWLDPPLERIANIWAQRTKTPVRDYIVKTPVVDAVKEGPGKLRAAIEEILRADKEIAAMGMELVSLQVSRVAPAADVEKALQTPTREQIQQKADEATFNRRALAVEKERAIKENELATEIELARRQEELIKREGANKLLEVQQQNEADEQRMKSALELEEQSAESLGRQTRVKAEADAAAVRTKAEAQAEAEQRRVTIYAKAPKHVALNLALQKFASNIKSINHLNITPDMLGSNFEQMLRDYGEGD